MAVQISGQHVQCPLRDVIERRHLIGDHQVIELLHCGHTMKAQGRQPARRRRCEDCGVAAFREKQTMFKTFEQAAQRATELAAEKGVTHYVRQHGKYEFEVTDGQPAAVVFMIGPEQARQQMSALVKEDKPAEKIRGIRI